MIAKSAAWSLVATNAADKMEESILVDVGVVCEEVLKCEVVVIVKDTGRLFTVNSLCMCRVKFEVSATLSAIENLGVWYLVRRLRVKRAVGMRMMWQALVGVLLLRYSYRNLNK